MSKAKTFTTFEHVEDVDEDGTIPLLPPGQAKTAYDDALDGLLSSLNESGNEAFISAYLQTGTGKERMGLVERWPVDAFESVDHILLYLRDNYGPGNYRLQVRLKGKLLANNLYPVIGKIKTVEQITRNSDGENNGVIRVMEMLVNKMDERFTEITRQLSGSGNSRTEMLNEMLVMKQLFSDGGNRGGISEIKDALAFVKDLGFNVGPPEEREESFGDIAGKFLPLLQTAVQQNNQRAQPQPAPRHQSGDKEMFVKMKIVAGVQMALKMAARKVDPAQAAETVVDMLGDDIASALVSEPDLVGFLSQYHAGVKEFSAWFIEVGEHVKAILGLPSTVGALYDAETDDSIDFDYDKPEQVDTQLPT